MAALRSILVALDGSRSSLAALEHAIALAEDYEATIEVLHVISHEDTLSAVARREVESAMEAGIARARAALGARVSCRTTVGDPLREIVNAARDVDLIVMGTHGRIGRLHALFGSVAEGVVRNAPCPVLTVRDSSEGYQSFAERRHGRPSLTEETSAKSS